MNGGTGFLFVVLFVCFTVVIFTSTVIMLGRFFQKVKLGKALIRTGIGGARVSFSGIIVIPILHQFQIIDISVRKITVSPHLKELNLKDGSRVNAEVSFFIRLNKSADDILKFADMAGEQGLEHPDVLLEMIETRLREVLDRVRKSCEFENRDDFLERYGKEILKSAETGDLGGFVIEAMQVLNSTLVL